MPISPDMARPFGSSSITVRRLADCTLLAYTQELGEIVALPKYAKQAKALLSQEERDSMEAAIASNPLAHPVISGTGGFRKARWSRGSSEKSGGIRTIYYYYVVGNTVYFTLMYAKNEQENISDAQKKQLKQLSQAIDAGR